MGGLAYVSEPLKLGMLGGHLARARVRARVRVGVRLRLRLRL